MAERDWSAVRAACDGISKLPWREDGNTGMYVIDDDAIPVAYCYGPKLSIESGFGGYGKTTSQGVVAFIVAAANTLPAALDEVGRLRAACERQNRDVSQTLGKALGYPRYADDPEAFPGAQEADGVCVGEHVAESLSVEAAREIDRLRARVALLENQIQ